MIPYSAWKRNTILLEFYAKTTNEIIIKYCWNCTILL